MSFLEDAFTRYHPTPTLDGHTPHDHLGLHGAGVVVVNALSTWLEVESRRDGVCHRQRYERGVPTGRLEIVGPAGRPGTTVRFLPDPSVFPSTWIDSEPLARRLRELAALFPSLTLSLLDRRRHVFHSPAGIGALLPKAPRGCSTLRTLELGEHVDGIRVDAVLAWRNDDAPPVVESYANVERTSEGGTHVAGLLEGLALGLLDVEPDWPGLTPTWARTIVTTGLAAVVRVTLADPSFAGPTRDKLDTREVGKVVSQVVRKAFVAAFRGEEAMRGRWRRGRRRGRG